MQTTTAQRIKSTVASRSVTVQFLTGLWAAVTAIHFAIWALIGVIGGHFDMPWPLLVSVPLGVILAGVYWFTNPTEPRTADELF